jgi:hypothetical protein
LLLGALLLGAVATAQVPTVVPFQGVIRDASGNIVGADTQVRFSIFSAPSGGSALWGPETHVVTPQNGVVSVFLGAGTPAVPNISAAFTGGDRYLEIQVSGTTLASRIRMGSTPYALTGGTVVDNAITSAKIADGAIATADIANSAVTSAKVADGGLSPIDMTPVFGRTQVSGIATITSSWAQLGTGAVTISVPGPGYIIADSSVMLNLNHASGTDDRATIGHTLSLGTQPAWYNVNTYGIPAVIGTGAGFFANTNVHSVHAVAAAGSYTVYLVGRMESGQDANDRLWWAEVSAQYIYNPSPTLDAPVPAQLTSPTQLH